MPTKAELEAELKAVKAELAEAKQGGSDDDTQAELKRLRERNAYLEKYR